MKARVAIDEALLDRAKQATGIPDTNELVKAGLEYLIARESLKRLIALGGTQPDIRPVPRRRSVPA